MADVAGRPPGTADEQQQQAVWQEIEAGRRPAPFHLMFLIVMMWMLTSGDNTNGFDVLTDQRAVEQARHNLRLRELRRDGLARWLGANESYAPVNASSGERPIELDLRGTPVPALVPVLSDLMTKNNHDSIYPYNLTGFINADWHLDKAWSFERLGFNETYNTTRRVQNTSATPATTTLDSEAALTEPISTWYNQTVTANRTANRGYFDWDATGGKIALSVHEDRRSVVGPTNDSELWDLSHQVDFRLPTHGWESEGPVAYAGGDATFSFPGGRDLQLDFEGVHFLKSGRIYAYLTPSSARSHIYDLINLPAFHNSKINTSSQAIGHAILREVGQRIDRERNEMSETGFQSAPSQGLASAFDEFLALSECELALFGVLSAIPTSPARYAEYYGEMFRPTGASSHRLPLSHASFLLYSENCGFILRAQGDFLPRASIWNRASSFTIVMGLTQGAIVWLLIKQMETSRSPGERARVAYWTVGCQAFLDAWLFVIMVTVGLVTKERASLSMLAAAFFSLAASLLFGMRFASVIRAAQPPPARSTANPTMNRMQSSVPTSQSGREASAELPDTMNSIDASERIKRFAFVIVFALFGFVLLFFGWLAVLMSVLYSYWVPQIVVNARRGASRRGPLRRDYVLGTSFLRLVLPLYLWACPSNLLYVKTSYWVYVLATWSMVQAGVLVAQNSRLGPRFFIPSTWERKLGLDEVDVWDWHPPLPEDLEKASQLVCPICMELIETGTKEERESAAAGIVGLPSSARWGYMVPPCHHIAHTHCLEHWLAIKSVCPVCRGPLPSL